jgi:hypothetical protein
VIRVVTKFPGQRAAEGQILDELRELQRFVGGYIEAVMKAHGFFGGGVADLVIYGDEEARLKDPAPALNVLRPTDGCEILGPLLAVKVNAAREHVSMTEAEAAAVVELFGTMRQP